MSRSSPPFNKGPNHAKWRTFLNGGDGYDTVAYYYSDVGVNVSLTTNIATGGHANGDTIANFEAIDGSTHNDILEGNGDFNDIWGFGRRRIDTNVRDLEYMIAYQIGALQAMASYADAKVTHLKPHGASVCRQRNYCAWFTIGKFVTKWSTGSRMFPVMPLMSTGRRRHEPGSPQNVYGARDDDGDGGIRRDLRRLAARTGQ